VGNGLRSKKRSQTHLPEAKKENLEESRKMVGEKQQKGGEVGKESSFHHAEPMAIGEGDRDRGGREVLCDLWFCKRIGGGVAFLA